MSWLDDVVSGAGEFFGEVGGYLGEASPYIKAGGALYDLFRNRKSASAGQMSALLGAAVDPDSPKFRNLAALFEESAKADALQGIRESYNQAARMKARGYTGQIINPERRDEARAGSIAQAFMGAGRQGRLEAQTALSGGAAGYAPLVNYDVGQEQAKSKRFGGAVEGIADLIAGFSPPQAPPQDQEYEFFSPYPGGVGYSEFA